MLIGCLLGCLELYGGRQSVDFLCIDQSEWNINMYKHIQVGGFKVECLNFSTDLQSNSLLSQVEEVRVWNKGIEGSKILHKK